MGEELSLDLKSILGLADNRRLQNRVYTRQEVHKTRYLATGSSDNGKFTRQKISNTGYSQSRKLRKTAIVHVLDKIKRKRQSGSDDPESLEVRDGVGSKGGEKVRGQELMQLRRNFFRLATLLLVNS